MEDKKQSQMTLVMRNVIAVSFVFAAGYLLGSNPNQSERLSTPTIHDEPLDESPFPIDFSRGNETQRILFDIDFVEIEDVDCDDGEGTCTFSTPVVSVDSDGMLYDEDMVNIDEIYLDLEASESHEEEQEFFEMETILMEEEITEEPTEEELEEPLTFLNDANDDAENLDYERKLNMFEVSEYEDDLDNKRMLMSHSDMFHVPLSCNEGVENKDCTTSFSSLVDNNNANNLLVIPCGECIIVDIKDGSVIDLPNGLSIEGKLYFPKTSSVTLKTKFVWVAGLLEIETPDVGKQIKFSLYGDEKQTFTAINPDSPLCSSGSGCNMGSKVIAVVGGRLDIKGDADNCPAWEKLTDIGTPTPRPFVNHLPCKDGNCWQDGTITLRGRCSESPGHTSNLGKYTVHCPIETKTLIPFGTREGIKFTSIAEAESAFEYPKDKNGKELSLTLAGSCGKAGHTNHFKRCVMHCPLDRTAVIPQGNNVPLTFTSVLPTVSPQLPPSTKNGQVELRLKNKCWNSQGHSKAYKRCAVMCRLFKTEQYNHGENTGQLEFTSKFREDPVPFPVPTSKTGNGEKGKFVLAGNCVYMAGHTNAWKGCVVRCPVQKTFRDFRSYHAAARLNNLENGKFVDVKRILQYAHGGVHMYLLLQDVSKDQCSAEGAEALNSVFETGDEITPSFQIGSDSSADGNTYDVDRILHYSWRRETFLFLPSEKDLDTCGDTANDFSEKFPPGYEVKIKHKNAAPGGETFKVDKVHHWAWGGRRIFFFPEDSDVGTCSQTVADFNSKFNKNYGIEVSKTKLSTSTGEEVLASKGIHHWSWNGNSLFFFPDVSAEEINKRFPVGYTIKVDYLTATDIQEVKVSPEAAKCWKPGTELLLTSHTRWARDQQVRIIESSDAEAGLLRLSEPINKPISLADHKDFAIEVAPLNRRIVFEAEGDQNDDKIGGHLIIHHTDTPQNIQGVEVRNFGQLGRLGRYPIHFHKCGDSPHSLVRKNIVRNSNQRCYVTHLSDRVTFEENVAYDAVGHCYFIEDGREKGNIFRRNLGSGIKKMPVEAAELLGAQSNREETDFTSSVFWISNPENYFYGNIAAGGEGHGYWFETHGDRRHLPLGAFVDNEVHSSARFAFTTYPPGWRPSQVGIIENLKAYRNPSWGAFLHVTQNLVFKGGIFADNSDKGVMISRGDDLVFDGTTFIGQTEFANKDCRNEKVGIHLDPVRLQETVIWSFSGNKKGSTVRNCKFLNFSQKDTNCNSESANPLKFFSHQTFIKAYSAPHVFENLEFDDPSYFVNAMMPGSGIDDVQIEVKSDQNGIFSSSGQPGFLVTEKLESMVPIDCSSLKNGLKFCPNTCIRTVSVLAGNSAYIDDDIVMVVTDENGREFRKTKDVRGHPGPQPVGNRFFASYSLSLPKGKFQIKFVDSNGSLSWPKSAFVVLEAAPESCSPYVDESDFEFIKPEPSRLACEQLVHNGDFEDGKDGWYALHHGIDLLEGGGIDGSKALATTKPLNSANNLAQNIDGSCLVDGDEYDISLSYKIVNYDGSNNLPYLRIQYKEFEISNPSNKKLQGRGSVTFHTTSGSFVPDGWNTISGVWKIDEFAAAADVHSFILGGGSHKIVIDNVSFKRRDQSSASPSLTPSSQPSLEPSEGPSDASSLAPTSQPSSPPSFSSSSPSLRSGVSSPGPSDQKSSNDQYSSEHGDNSTSVRRRKL